LCRRRHRAQLIAKQSFGSRRSTGCPHQDRPFVTEGGLMAYGSDIVDNFRRASHFVDRILRGTKVSELPIEYPTKFELTINLKTAKALGLTIPETLLATADEVIQ
jgi:putative ABC transport system substrate-binding protein